MKIHFITTGGTIDKVYFDAKSEYEIGSPQVLEVLEEAGVAFEYEIEQALAKDSLEITDADRQLIRTRVAASTCDRIVITHGTDTMAETARLLRDVPGKTIVLTGAMQPARFRNTDATFNIGMAIGAVSALPPGVYLAMNGLIFDPDRVRKNRDKHCFEAIPS
jgi:L-asparaginase